MSHFHTNSDVNKLHYIWWESMIGLSTLITTKECPKTCCSVPVCSVEAGSHHALLRLDGRDLQKLFQDPAMLLPGRLRVLKWKKLSFRGHICQMRECPVEAQSVEPREPQRLSVWLFGCLLSATDKPPSASVQNKPLSSEIFVLVVAEKSKWKAQNPKLLKKINVTD